MSFFKPKSIATEEAPKLYLRSDGTIKVIKKRKKSRRKKSRKSKTEKTKKIIEYTLLGLLALIFIVTLFLFLQESQLLKDRRNVKKRTSISESY